MAMKQIFLPHGLRLNSDTNPDDRETLRRDYEQRTQIALDQWQRAIREGFENIAQYDTSDEGKAYVVFVLHRRRASKTGMLTPRMKAAQAVVNLDVAFAALVKARIQRKACRVLAKDEGTDEALLAEREGEQAVQMAHSRVIRMARKLMSATSDLLDQTL